MTTWLRTQTHYFILINLIEKFYEDQEDFIEFVNNIADIWDKWEGK